MGRINVQGGSQIKPPLETTVNQVIEGCQFSVNGKDILIGTMVNRGVLGVTPNDSEQNFPAGYYPSITVAARPALSGDAATGNVLAGKTFYSDAYNKLTGSMVDRGALNLTPSDSIQTGSAGYYSGITVAARPVLSGNALAIYVLEGFTFYSNSYTKLTGTIPIRTNSDTGGSYPDAVNQSIYPGMLYLIPSAGYYSGSVWVKSSAPNIIPANVKKGVQFSANMIGTMEDAAVKESKVRSLNMESNLHVQYYRYIMEDGLVSYLDGGVLRTTGRIRKKKYNAAGTLLSTNDNFITGLGSNSNYKHITTPRKDVICVDEYIAVREYTYAGTLLGTWTWNGGDRVRIKNGNFLSVGYDSTSALYYNSAGTWLTSIESGASAFFMTCSLIQLSDTEGFLFGRSRTTGELWIFKVTFSVSSISVGGHMSGTLMSVPAILAMVIGNQQY
jgi:hypothetical protein